MAKKENDHEIQCQKNSALRKKKEDSAKLKRKRNTVLKHKNLASAKTSIELLYHSNERGNYLFRMCFVHGSEHEFASV